VTFFVTLGLVLAAVYELVSLSSSVLVAAAWRLGFERTHPSANELLAVRLLPAGIGALLTLTIVLPAFMVSEPAHELEVGGPLLVGLALLALLTVGVGICRAVRACIATSTFLRHCGPVHHRPVVTGEHVDIVDLPEPVVAVVGGWRPTIVASANVLSACSDEEFCQVVAHESAHVSALDNFKLFLLVLSPDALAWLPAGAALAARWRAAAEREADERAAGSDRGKRLALASALIKVARLSISASSPLPALSMPIAVDDVEGRVRGLLARSPPARRSMRLWALAAASLMVPVIGLPLYGVVHQLIEALVAFGR
jgi:hypothetical protein